MGYFPPQSNIDFFGGENFYEESQKKEEKKETFQVRAILK